MLKSTKIKLNQKQRELEIAEESNSIKLSEIAEMKERRAFEERTRDRADISLNEYEKLKSENEKLRIENKNLRKFYGDAIEYALRMTGIDFSEIFDAVRKGNAEGIEVSVVKDDISFEDPLETKIAFVFKINKNLIYKKYK